MDLHTWLIEQVDRAEASARAELEYRRILCVPHDGGPALTGTVTGVTQTPSGMQLDVAQYGVEPRDGTASVQSVAAALRRCEADRSVLNRHNSWAALFPRMSTSSPTATACHGCGTEGYCEDHVTENLNDCPELLDLAHAHGITPEILAGLDRPQVPEPKRSTAPRINFADVLAPRTPTSGVPEALRGPNWRPAG